MGKEHDHEQKDRTARGQDQEPLSKQPGTPEPEPAPPPPSWRGTLLITPYARFAGELELHEVGQEDGKPARRVETPLQGAIALVLFILERAWDEDEGQREPQFRGYRPQSEILKEHRRLTGHRTPYDVKTINVYVGRLRKVVQNAWAEAGLPGPAPEPIETSKKGRGYRLAMPLEVKIDMVTGKEDPEVGD